jgi:hypothetical protein
VFCENFLADRLGPFLNPPFHIRGQWLSGQRTVQHGLEIGRNASVYLVSWSCFHSFIFLQMECLSTAIRRDARFLAGLESNDELLHSYNDFVLRSSSSIQESYDAITVKSYAGADLLGAPIGNFDPSR